MMPTGHWMTPSRHLGIRLVLNKNIIKDLIDHSHRPSKLLFMLEGRAVYDAAAMDGAGRLAQFRHVTFPMITPLVFYNVVVGIIGSFQVFTAAYIATQGGPAHTTLYYVLFLYRHAFENLRMGYASVLAWVLFFIILLFTVIQFRVARLWVFYEVE